jgi:hypothetical protein
MNTTRPKQKTSASYEYFLYAAIIAETALAAFVYKTIFRDPDLARLSLFFGIFYFAFLAWSIFQLNKVHRNRKLAQAEPAAAVQQDRPVAPRRSRSALGLTVVQLVIVVVVFASAVATFSWALRLLR